MPRETGNNVYAKLGGTNKEYYGIFQSGYYAERAYMIICIYLFTTICSYRFFFFAGGGGETLKTAFFSSFYVARFFSYE